MPTVPTTRIRLKKLVYRPLEWLDTVAQALAPVRADRICYTSHPDYADNAYHLFRHVLQTRNGLEHIWLLRYDFSLNTRIEQDFRTLTVQAGTTGHRLRIVRRRSIIAYWLYLTSRHVFHTHGMYGFSKRSLKRNIVALWHGMPIKCIGWLNHLAPNPIPTFGTLHIASSHFFRHIIANAFRVPPEQILVCQQPRCDALVHEDARCYKKNEIRECLDLPSDKKLILWMPTYRTEPSALPINTITVRSFLDDLDDAQLRSLSDAAIASNAVILIKLHPYDRLNEIDVPLNYSGFSLLKSPQWQQFAIPLYDLVAASDALISDISSVLIDYLITGRPIGIFGLNPATYPRDTTFPLTYIFSSARFQQIDTPESCFRFMQSVSQHGTRGVPENDIAQIFYQNFQEQGSEQILRAVGL